MSKVSSEKLSEHDQKVIDSIFNPFQIGGDNDDGEPDAETVYKMELDDQLEAERKKNRNPESVRLELDAIRATEEKDYVRALELFERAIKIDTKETSLWNNRAQTYRICGNENGEWSKRKSLSKNHKKILVLLVCHRWRILQQHYVLKPYKCLNFRRIKSIIDFLSFYSLCFTLF